MSSGSRPPPRAADLCVVRPAEEGDYDRIAELAGQLGYPSTASDVRSRLEHLRDPREFALYVAELDDGRVAGWIGVRVVRTVETDPEAEINGLVVDEAVRSRGVGAALLRAAETWARDLGGVTLRVRSNVIRTGAHAFYRRHGFVSMKTQVSFRKRL